VHGLPWSDPAQHSHFEEEIKARVSSAVYPNRTGRQTPEYREDPAGNG